MLILAFEIRHFIGNWKFFIVFALDLSSSHLRVLELIKKGNIFVLNGLGEKEFFSHDKIPQLLQELVKTTKPNPITSTELALGIPEEESFIKIIQLPKKEPAELKLLLQEEMSKILPYDQEEVHWDWKVVGPSDQKPEYLDITFIASPRTTLDKYMKLVKSAGFEPALVETEANALLWGARNPFDNNAFTESTLIIDIGTSKTTIVIFARGAIRFTTSLKLDTKAMKPPDYLALSWQDWVKQNKKDWLLTEKRLLTLAEKLREYIDYYETSLAPSDKKKREPLQNTIVCGPWANFGELLEILSKKLRMPVRGPENVIPVHPAYTTALGLALRGAYEEYYTKS